jgi:mannose-6-phosphate isomerase-like protein (cupin superfamily)
MCPGAEEVVRMPVLHGDMNQRPSWCELEHFEIVSLPPSGRIMWKAEHKANKMVVVEGEGKIALTTEFRAVSRGSSLDVPAGAYAIHAEGPATLVTLGGHWGEDCGGAGIFGVRRAEKPGDIGDPVTYPKHTAFDRHYHDCDEYWILVTGRGTASSEDVSYDVGPGDCVATRMGHHHDFPLVEDPVLAVFFETTMRGQMRRGHLWEHTHGPAVPATAEGE